MSSYVTRNLRYQKCVLSVSGVVYRRNEICYDPTNLIDAIEPFLTEDMSINKIPNGGVKIICPTRHVCHISQLSFNIILSRQLEVSLFLETKPIDPTSFGIYERLPRFSSHTIPGLLLSIQSLQLCIGEQSTSKLQRQGLMYFNYRNVNSTVELLHCRAPNCDLLLRPAKVDDICDHCRYALRYKPTCERKQRKIVKLVDTGTTTEPVVDIETLLQQLFPNIVGHDDLGKHLSMQLALAQDKDPRGHRYDKKLISLSLTLWGASPHSYNKLKQSGMILPSERLLAYYKNAVYQKPGIQPNMMRWMYMEAKKMGPNTFVGGLLLDEMNVQEDLKMCNKDGVWTLHGLKEMGGTANSVDSMLHPELALADHVLQYMYHGLSGFRMPFCYYATKQANAAQLYSMTSKCLSALAAHEFEIVYISLDGSSNNRSWIKLLMPDPLGCKMTFTSRIDGSQKIVVIPDPSHVLKKIRNAAAQSDPSFKDASNTFSRLLVWNGYEIIWQHWIDAYEWSKNRDLNPLSPHRHLTCESIHLTTIGKMRNNFAYETLNDRMLTLMKAYKASPHLSPQQSEKLAGTVAFLENTAVLVRNFRDTHKLEDPSDPRLQENDQVLKWFSEWENNTPQAEKQKHLMSSQCREDLS